MAGFFAGLGAGLQTLGAGLAEREKYKQELKRQAVLDALTEEQILTSRDRYRMDEENNARENLRQLALVREEGTQVGPESLKEFQRFPELAGAYTRREYQDIEGSPARQGISIVGGDPNPLMRHFTAEEQRISGLPLEAAARPEDPSGGMVWRGSEAALTPKERAEIEYFGSRSRAQDASAGERFARTRRSQELLGLEQGLLQQRIDSMRAGDADRDADRDARFAAQLNELRMRRYLGELGAANTFTGTTVDPFNQFSPTDTYDIFNQARERLGSNPGPVIINNIGRELMGQQQAGAPTADAFSFFDLVNGGNPSRVRAAANYFSEQAGVDMRPEDIFTQPERFVAFAGIPGAFDPTPDNIRAAQAAKDQPTTHPTVRRMLEAWLANPESFQVR